MSSNRTLHTLLRLWVLTVFCALTGCGSAGPIVESAHSTGFDIPWPGDGPPARMASDDTVKLLGNEYALLGGAAAEEGTTVELTGGGDLPYAIYTLGGFLPPLEFSGLALDAVLEEASPGDGTRLYVGLANYSRNCWDWVAADGGGWDSGPLTGADCRSGSGTAGIAVVLDGPGSATINSLTISRTGDTTLRPPDPITADPWVGRITIAWDKVPVAEGYNIYRDEWPELPDPQKLNSEPVTRDFYQDVTVTDGVMYYYFVTSVARGEESAPSMMLDVFAPEVNLPEPTNLRVIESTAHTATVAWDWALAPPNKFQLYLDDQQDFNLVDPLQSPTVDGETWQCTIHKLAGDTKYRWRVCSYFGGRRGRMADDRSAVTRWDWGPMELVGTGTGRVAALRAGTDLAAAYVNDTVVNFSKRYNGEWFEETVLDLELFDRPDQFEYFVDLAYGGGRYIVTGWSVYSGDMWVATGVPGSMVAERIHGDGSTGMGHENSGLGGTATVTPFEYVVVHTLYEKHSTLIQTRPLSGGEWTLTTFENGSFMETPYNLASLGDNAYLLMKDINTGALLFGDMNGGWEFTPVIPPGDPRVFFNSDLVRFGNKWVSPLRDASNALFIMVEGNEPPWTIELLADEDVGATARMDAQGDTAGIVYTAWGRWWFGFTEDGGAEWKITEINITEYHLRERPDIAFLDGSPYLVFSDYWTGEVKAAKGVPPPP